MYNCMFSRLINSEIIADPLKPIIIKLITVCARRNRFQNWKRSIKSINNLLFFCIWTGTRAKLRARARTYTSTLYPFHLFVCSAFQSQIRRKKNDRGKKRMLRLHDWKCCSLLIAASISWSHSFPHFIAVEYWNWELSRSIRKWLFIRLIAAKLKFRKFYSQPRKPICIWAYKTGARNGRLQKWSESPHKSRSLLELVNAF